MENSERQKITLDVFREKAREHNLCPEFTKIWDMCNTRKDVIDMCLGSKGIDYTCNAISQNWGISPSEICKTFWEFINGRYVSINNNGAYTSEMYCEYKGASVVRTTAIAVINSSIELTIPEYIGIFKIYIVGECTIKLKGTANCVIVAYGDLSNINVDEGKAKVKYIHKLEADTYE